MSKSKKKTEYLPLQWCKKLDYQCKETIGDISCDDMECLLSVDKNDWDRKAELLVKYPIISKTLDFLSRGSSQEEAYREFFSDFDAMYNIKKWAQNKQVFKFDKDFLEELIRTENLHMTKDLFDYLPFKHFYIDISDDRELCEEIFCDGMFIYVTKDYSFREDKEECIWRVHVCKVNSELFFVDIFPFENIDGDRQRFAESERTNVKIQSFNETTGEISTSEKEINVKKYENIVFQILTYLASTESDIVENEVTKQTYRKPNPEYKPKHKFSEIQSYDVGYRYGSTFRKWKKESSKLNDDKAEHGSSKGHKVRPHARRAHWSHFWYGKRNSEDRVCRAKWISETFVGLKSTDNEAVIHSVKK